ncbi:hypothetical protein HN371_06685 [Candidatus Poribacteria bacterium]|jgi:hypothetical protein|nr:hypothetical protein [Candidatus Poribacteria bacterium]MBT5535661.1 hypothetical protein [Candidatus Poribacteria bacterium]MBT5713984.1 hypothetical protein [Candidatus Poribacteria bacterium]MBT7100683.1 hypothetical protein [Candidatus Poribacteria bacterium]MBT7806671.1 hypothetical protein [Candidatus Poribacteria bacterium]
MAWERRETHHVGSYAFHWFSDGDGSWLIAIWSEAKAPSEPREADVASALTVQHIPVRDNPKGKTRPVREFCERFMSDIPFRVRAIRNKVPTLRRLRANGVVPDAAEDG